MPRQEYELIPAQRPKGSSPPQGWVSLDRGMKPAPRRRLTEGYLNTRLNRDTTIAHRQNYILKVINNPMTPEENRQAAIRYVADHPERFMPLRGDPDDREFTVYAESRNGSGANPGFVRKVLGGCPRRCPSRYRMFRIVTWTPL